MRNRNKKGKEGQERRKKRHGEREDKRVRDKLRMEKVGARNSWREGDKGRAGGPGFTLC